MQNTITNVLQNSRMQKKQIPKKAGPNEPIKQITDMTKQ